MKILELSSEPLEPRIEIRDTALPSEVLSAVDVSLAALGLQTWMFDG